jgi:Raf kinase inhibitor-like YbhB/YbcL family protein
MTGMHLGALRISSPDFDGEGRIPERHTAAGGNIAPVLRFDAVPSAALSLAVVCHDPDAPLTYGFDHWVVYDIPATQQEIGPDTTALVTEGVNSVGTPGYTGPAPPPGHGLHHYFFHLYALDARLDAPSGLTHRDLLERIDEHIIEQARLVGTFSVD